MTGIEKLRDKLKKGELCVGSGITFTDPLVTEALAGYVDHVYVDLEHAAMSMEAVQAHLLATRAKRTAGLVRVTSSGTPFIKPVLDAGADGILVPHVHSADEVRRIVDDCYYPPMGKRGFGPRVPSDYGRSRGTEYVRQANESMFVVVMIETAEVLEDLDVIVRIPGVSALLIGPWDFSGALGVLGDVRSATVMDAIDRVVAAAKVTGLPVGCGTSMDMEYAKMLIEHGIRWLLIGPDYRYMIATVERLKGELGAE